MASSRVCRVIRPARIGVLLSCAAGAMLSPWRAGSGGCQAPWTVSMPHRPSGSPCSNFFYDRQVLFHRHSCRPATGNRLGADHMSYIKKTREWPAPKGTGQLLVSSSLYFVSFDFRKLLLPYDPISCHFCLSKMTHSHLGSQSFLRTA